MDAANPWQRLFESWPPSIPRQGMLVTQFQETIPFTDFLISPGVLLVQRDRPDSLGARKVMVAFSAIAAVKMTDVAELSKMQPLGFRSPA